MNSTLRTRIATVAATFGALSALTFAIETSTNASATSAAGSAVPASVYSSDTASAEPTVVVDDSVQSASSDDDSAASSSSSSASSAAAPAAVDPGRRHAGQRGSDLGDQLMLLWSLARASAFVAFGAYTGVVVWGILVAGRAFRPAAPAVAFHRLLGLGRHGRDRRARDLADVRLVRPHHDRIAVRARAASSRSRSARSPSGSRSACRSRSGSGRRSSSRSASGASCTGSATPPGW